MRWVVVMACLVVGCTSSTIDLDDSDSGAAGQTGDGPDDGASDDGGTDAADGTDGPETDTDPSVTIPEPDTGDPTNGLPEGRYLLIVDTVISPGTPLQWEVIGNSVAGTITGQSLSLDVMSLTEPRELVGGIWEANVAAQFDAELPALQILGEANPITGAEIITGPLKLVGAALGDGSYCGEVAGEVQQPIMVLLDGSTFALVPVADGQPWPVDFPLACPV